jgi:hypothetical protein
VLSSSLYLTLFSTSGQSTVTLHIQTHGPGSWTYQLRALLQMMGPGNACVKFSRQEGPNVVPGRIVDPTGQQLFQIDGPHAAPTQHVAESNTVVVIGAGIGVTPVAATLKSVVFYRWRRAFGKCYPAHAHFSWLCSWTHVPSFRWVALLMKQAHDEVVHMRRVNNDMKDKRFSIHVYITSYPDPAPPQSSVPRIEDPESRLAFWGSSHAMENEQESGLVKHASKFSVEDLYELLINPRPGSVSLGDITVTRGRPDWSQVFEPVHERTSSEDVAVTFCGNPAIADALRNTCNEYNARRGNQGGQFRLFKENF